LFIHGSNSRNEEKLAGKSSIMMSSGDYIDSINFNVSDGFRMDIVNLTTDANADGFPIGLVVEFTPTYPWEGPFPHFYRGRVDIRSSGMTQVIMSNRTWVNSGAEALDPYVESFAIFNSISMKRTPSSLMIIQVDGIGVTSIMSNATLSPVHGIQGKLLVAGFDNDKYAMRITPICGP
jgi:hypothetical protein